MTAYVCLFFGCSTACGVPGPGIRLEPLPQQCRSLQPTVLGQGSNLRPGVADTTDPVSATEDSKPDVLLFIFCSFSVSCFVWVFWGAFLWITWLFFMIPSWFICIVLGYVSFYSFLSGALRITVHLWLTAVDRYCSTILRVIWEPFFH